MTGENRLGVELLRFLLPLVGAHEIRQPAQRQFSILAFGGKLRVRERLDSYERNSLEVRAVVAGGLGAEERELRRHILGGKLATSRAHAASFEKVARQELDVSADALTGDLLHLGRQAESQRKNGNECSHPCPPTFQCTSRGGRGAGGRLDVR